MPLLINNSAHSIIGINWVKVENPLNDPIVFLGTSRVEKKYICICRIEDI
jgi:hypothetical protein